MKHFFLILFLIASSSTFSQNNKMANFYGKWKQFGYKNHNDSIIKTGKEDCGNKIIEFSKDNRYEEEMLSLKGIGIWQFNSDSTRFGFLFTEYMGQKVPRNSLPISFNSIILKLTKDTLIIGNEAFYGPNKIKGHDDWYYLRIK